MTTNKYLKPMLDTGSPRVFNCNVMTQKILAADLHAAQFFRTKALNTCVLIKDTAPESDSRKNGPSVGTKLYFPFNTANIYEGGRTIFIHDRHLEAAITEQYGAGALEPKAFAEDLHILKILDRLPSLDPFLMKDVFLREKIDINPAYFVISQELWNEIETFMLLQFEALVRAAFPNTLSSDNKARQLINTIWEARDVVALKPLIDAFRLPQDEALDIFSSWKGIVYYTFQYSRDKTKLIELMQWLKTCEGSTVGMPPTEAKELRTMVHSIAEQVRLELQTIESTVRKYDDGYDKMFKHKTSSTEFLTFLRGSNQTYWTLGNSIGKTNQGVYCWQVMAGRFAGHKMPFESLLPLMHILAKIFEPEKKTTTASAWS